MSMPMPQPNQFGVPQVGAYPMQPNLMQNHAPTMNSYPNVQQNFAPPLYDQQQAGLYNQGSQFGFNQNMVHHQQYMTDMSNYPQQQHQVIMQQPTYQQQPNVQIIQHGAVGAHSQIMTCPNCHETAASKVESKANSSTHMTACLLCFLGCFCGCCLLPYFFDSCQSQKHSCKKCGAYLGNSIFKCLKN